MGMNLLPFHFSEPYSSRKRLPKEDPCHEKVRLGTWIVENMKPTCLRRKKRKQKQKKVRQQQQQQKMGKELTLEEWLLRSPIIEKNGNCNGEHYGYKHDSGSDYPSVAGEYSLSLEQLLRSEDYTPVSEDYGISSEKLLKDEKVDVKEMEFNSLTTRNQSSQVKKRVSFRLPKVSDIIIFHPSGFEE